MSQLSIPIGFDTETHLIGPENLAPRLVCVSVCLDGEKGLVLSPVATGPYGWIQTTIGNSNETLVGHNAAYDLTVLAMYEPEQFPIIFQALAEGRIHDTMIREMLLNIADQGDLDYLETPDGSKKYIEYHLANLVKQYLGVDLSDAKEAEDAWRLRYGELDGKPTDQWPPDAVKYAAEDAVWPVLVWQKQEERRVQIQERKGIDPFITEPFQVAVSFVLRLMSMRGMATDAAAVADVEAMLAVELAPDKLNLIVDAGVLEPAQPERPYANNAKAHRDDCADHNNCDCPLKMKAATDEKLNKKKLEKFVLELAKARPNDVTLKYTKKGNLSIDAEWIEEHSHLHPMLEQLQHRQELQKLVTTEIPRMKYPEKTVLDGVDVSGQLSPVVHPCYRVVKATNRTSSYADKLFPSFNGQNVDPRVRGCYVPREGFWLFSNDYSQMELGTLAQTCLNLFGTSVLADKINAGIDPHSYLGAQLAFHLDADFQAVCGTHGMNSPEQVYEAFKQCSTSDAPEEARKFYKHYRTFAKPTGLGYPGGLGPRTFIQYAKSPYGVIVDLETATMLRDIWKQTFPEMNLYFDYINNQCVDPYNKQKVTVDERTGEERVSNRYHYQSPGGFYRAGCDYCAAANGLGLQTPAAEGAKLSVWEVGRACFDESQGNDKLLGKAIPILFIHDEIVGEVVADRAIATAAVREMGEIMVRAMRVVTPDVRAAYESALMTRWGGKEVESHIEEDGLLSVWSPSEKEVA